MAKTLSHSQIAMYQTCSAKYDFHYNHRLREKVTSGALLFGSALDNTANEILKDFSKLKTLSYYQTIFRQNWLHGRINSNVVELPESTLVAYAAQDYDEELLTEGDIAAIHDRALQLGVITHAPGAPKREVIVETYGRLAAIKNYVGVENTYENTAKFINLVNWHVMLRKGELMVATYITQVIPQIAEVLAIQKKVEIKNEEGDSIIGYIDAVLKFTGEDFPRITDLKTSARAYEEGAADISPQLATYGHALEISKNAFIVFSKAIKKNRSKICTVCNHNGTGSRARTCDNGEGKARCGGAWAEEIQPEATMEIIKGEINPVFEGHVLDNYEYTLRGINAEAFPRNFNSCFSYGRKCQFWNKCHTGEEDDLIKV